MHVHQLDAWRHGHAFVDLQVSRANERRSLFVVALTTVAMVVEIGAGWAFNSMALLADGWHMATHACALGIAVLAYRYARRHAANSRFTFGVGKVEILGGFTSAIVLALVALAMALESAHRLFSPLSIAFDEAMLVAVLGLAVNLVCARILHAGQTVQGHGHGHGHGHDHAHSHARHGRVTEHRDQNLRAAYIHVIADALTSVLAIVALMSGKVFGWVWMDAAMGIVGAIVIGWWAVGLLRDTGRILVDSSVDDETATNVRQAIEGDADNRVVDLHVWWIGPQSLGVIVSLVTHYPRSPEHYRTLLTGVRGVAHVTVEVNTCDDEPCLPLPRLDATRRD